ncbi:MAG: DUF3012 domain-containing protein [Gammaproteobacteria bacterium]
MRHSVPRALLLSLVFLLGACAPEVGSKRWCEKLRDTPKGDWSLNEAADYAKHCILPRSDDSN